MHPVRRRGAEMGSQHEACIPAWLMHMHSGWRRICVKESRWLRLSSALHMPMSCDPCGLLHASPYLHMHAPTHLCTHAPHLLSELSSFPWPINWRAEELMFMLSVHFSFSELYILTHEWGTEDSKWVSDAFVFYFFLESLRNTALEARGSLDFWLMFL